MYRQSAYYRIQQADAQLDAKHYKEAAATLKIALETDPTQIVALYNLGYAFLQLGNDTNNPQQKSYYFAQAEHAFLQVSNINPDLSLTWFRLGKLALLQGDPQRAQTYYQTGTELNPQNATLWFNLGTVSERLEQWDKAKKAYRTAIKVNPKFIYAYNNLGLLFEQFHDPTAAEKTYRAALQVSPDYTFARLNLATMLQGQHRLEEALKQYQAVTAADPKNVWAYLYAGNILFQQGQYEAALSHYRHVLAINPNYSPAYYLTSLALEKLNRPSEAVQQGETYVRLDPSGPYAKDADELIMTLKGHAPPVAP